MAAYKATPQYMEYLNDGERPGHLPPYEKIKGNTLVYPGELYCHFRDEFDICPYSRQMINGANPRNHIKRVHGATICAKAGAPSVAERHQAKRWYAKLAKVKHRLPILIFVTNIQ